MWIIPTPCEQDSSWECLQENELFLLQKTTTKPSLWTNLLGTLRTLFDVHQSPFRIVLKTGSEDDDPVVTMAVGSGRREVEEDWAWLEVNIVAPARESGDVGDLRLMTYNVCKVIEDLVTSHGSRTDEATSDESFRTTARSFRQTFLLPETERLVNCT